MGKITFPRPALLKNHEFSRCFRTKTHYDSLLTEGITCKTIPRNQARNFCGGGQFCARIVPSLRNAT